jgi:filamentous hemagglutinin
MLKLLLQLIFISTFSLAYLTNEATINVENNTHIEGSTIASGTIDENGNLIQNDNLELNTNTLTYKHLSNTTVSKGNSAGGGYSGNGDNVNANFSQDITYEKSKTLATTNAKVNVEDTKNSDDLSRINTDTANTNKDIFSAQSSVEVDLKVDTRMLSEDGRKQIKDDIVTSKTMVDAVEQIIETDKAGIQDFFAETQKNIDVYEGMKEEIRNNPTLAQQLANPNLSPEQKQQMLQSVANTVKESLGYKTKKDDVKLVSTDKKGANDTQFKGHYNSDGKGNGDKNTYINDKNNKDTQDLLTTIGHETQHNMDEQKQIYKQNDKDQNTYATNFGEDVASYTDAALDIVAKIPSVNFCKTIQNKTIVITPGQGTIPALNATAISLLFDFFIFNSLAFLFL